MRFAYESALPYTLRVSITLEVFWIIQMMMVIPNMQIPEQTLVVREDLRRQCFVEGLSRLRNKAEDILGSFSDRIEQLRAETGDAEEIVCCRVSRLSPSPSPSPSPLIHTPGSSQR